MNDNELMTLVRSQRDKVTLSVPVEQIVARGRRLRVRRRAPVAAVGIAAVASAGIVFESQIPPTNPTSHDTSATSASQAGRQPAVRLAAWSVTRLVDGNISVTLRELRDPSGLQATLRAEGVAASVTFDRLNPSCQPYPASIALLDRVFPGYDRDLPSPPPGEPSMSRVTSSASLPSPSVPLPDPGSTVVVIDPSALPSATAVQLATSTSSAAILVPRLVYANSQCSGS